MSGLCILFWCGVTYGSTLEEEESIEEEEHCCCVALCCRRSRGESMAASFLKKKSPLFCLCFRLFRCRVVCESCTITSTILFRTQSFGLMTQPLLVRMSHANRNPAGVDTSTNPPPAAGPSESGGARATNGGGSSSAPAGRGRRAWSGGHSRDRRGSGSRSGPRAPVPCVHPSTGNRQEDSPASRAQRERDVQQTSERRREAQRIALAAAMELSNTPRGTSNAQREEAQLHRKRAEVTSPQRFKK